MESRLNVDIQPQPDDFTCGPTCLDAIYRYYDDELPLQTVIAEVPQLDSGGTLAVYLGCHALRRTYDVTLYTYNLQIFDPTWFGKGHVDLAERLRAQKEIKEAPKLRRASDAYLEFLSLGGKIRYEELTTALIRKYLNNGIPILTGLSATYLHGSMREYGPNGDHDDIRGEPTGHFVVLCGYDKHTREVLVADPLFPNPLCGSNKYAVSIDRVIGAIFLGIVTYDGNFLIIQPKHRRKERPHADPHRSQQHQ